MDKQYGLTMSEDEAAELLGIGRSSVYDAIKSGKIPTIETGIRRFPILTAGIEKLLHLNPGDLRNP